MLLWYPAMVGNTDVIAQKTNKGVYIKMVYDKYITKKRFKGLSLSGNVNLPYGTICVVNNGMICLDDKAICYLGSQTAIDYFWGYDESNPAQEIERQKLIDELYKIAPKDDGDALMDKTNSWHQYGEIIDYGVGMCQWSWKDNIFDLPVDRLRYLLNCIKKGDRPLCIGL